MTYLRDELSLHRDSLYVGNQDEEELEEDKESSEEKEDEDAGIVPEEGDDSESL